ncbi:MAG: conjugative transfer ATPase, partial [Candidatus Cloacimonetes bacterium]|nr:conjugative transfer ATPase [Candidatus Cloacimonadota bacterium]
TPCDAYLRFLPMAFDYEFDKRVGIRRSRYIYARQIANMLPLYGRYRGTESPCILRWNRVGEPLYFDPFSKHDKSANSHVLYLSETGGGKSASLVWDLKSTIAIYNPRVFIIEAGDSFSLFCEDAKSLGKTVNQVKLSAKNPTPLNPFSDAFKILDNINDKKVSIADENVTELMEHLSDSYSTDDEYDADEERDILGEMALAVQLMITGGEKAEENKFTRANRTIVLEAIVDATKFVKHSKRDEVIAEDIVLSLIRLSQCVAKEENNPNKVARIQEMADSMMNFTTDKFTAAFFNQKGKPWPDADITRLDMGLMKHEQYGPQLSLAMMGMLNRIAHTAETTQYDDRMTIVLIDESHILTKNPLTAASITQFSKMCRKLGVWLWLATQNMADFPDESRKMLSMIEFWVGLGTSESEIDEIRRFKKITEEEKNLFMSVHKDIPNYVEGVVMSRKIKGLFRNVPPRIALALGMTEKDEKAKRLFLMKKHNINELGAANMMADQMNEKLLNKKEV